MSLPGNEQAAVVAYYRVHNKLEALIDKYRSDQSTLQSKQAAAKSGRKH